MFFLTAEKRAHWASVLVRSMIATYRDLRMQSIYLKMAQITIHAENGFPRRDANRPGMVRMALSCETWTKYLSILSRRIPRMIAMNANVVAAQLESRSNAIWKQPCDIVLLN